MDWSKASVKVSVIGGTLAICSVVFGLALSGVDKFHTDDEAALHVQDFQSYQLQQRKESQTRQVEWYELKLKEIDFQLLGDSLNDRQRANLVNQRRDVERKISCLNRGEC